MHDPRDPDARRQGPRRYAGPPERNGRSYWSPPGDPVQPVEGRLDVEAPETDAVRPVRKRPPAHERRGSEVPVGAARVGEVLAEDDAIQRVGGRRRFRPEVALLIVGAVFLAGALAKPWPSPAPAASHAPATVTPIPQAIALATSPAVTPQDVQIGVPGEISQNWSTVDWSALLNSDQHPGWGFAAAAMPALVDARVGPAAPLPSTSWIDAGSPPATATVPVGFGRSVYALAVTWPSNLQVTSVTFVFLGGPSNPPYLPPAGFPAFTQVSPLPAERVAWASVAPTPSPSFGSSANHAAGAIRSGEFWIPPSEASPIAISGPIPAAWQTLPWSWPNGTYRVTVTSASGTTKIVLHLEQAT